MKPGTTDWESRLWSYLSRGDGVHCPIYRSCRTRVSGCVCLSDQYDYYARINRFIDNDHPDSLYPVSITPRFRPPTCITRGSIFQLVRRLANSYAELAGLEQPPVPSDLITQLHPQFPIEVRRIPLKAYRGAVWRLSDCWVVHLNSADTPARQRFTLYHEIFHILAHGKATPVFKKSADHREGFFNEMLADHFAAVILLPSKLVKRVWPGVKDIKQMSDLFETPYMVTWTALKHLRLV